MISAKEKFTCVKEMITMVSVMACGPIISTLKDYTVFLKRIKTIGSKEGDHLTEMNIYLYWKRLRGSDARSRFCSEFKVNERALAQADDMAEKLKWIMR